MNKEILEKLFPENLPSPLSIEAKYPSRQLPEGAMVTRVAPSPTGFMHVGTLYAALISERLAHQSGGVFYLRIEDTDQKREVEGATELIVKSLAEYDVRVDEGEITPGQEVGAYGPYKQSARAEIYKAYVKDLVEKGRAYPCFCTPEELDIARQQQEMIKTRTGYYGTWAKCRTKSEGEILEALAKGKTFAIRFKSPGLFTNKVRFDDLIKGKMTMADNDLDIPILKSEGLPTYHFAHVVDDHLMHTTHVTRGDEWLASVPLHLQLFQALGWTAPHYSHIAPINKLDQGNKRKLSKRKDPEASLSFYAAEGYPKNAVLEYLTNLANSNFEDWRKANPHADLREFKLTLEKLAHSSGALFDFVKLDDTSKQYIARLSAEQVYQMAVEWAQIHDAELLEIMASDLEYTKKILNIERGEEHKARKDLARWNQLKNEIIYFYDSKFVLEKPQALALLAGLQPEDISAVLKSFQATYNLTDSKDTWFEKMKLITRENGFADNMKEFKATPEKFKGSVVDVTKIFRVLLTGRTQTPDLHSIMQVMGVERINKRLGIVF